MKWTDSGVGRRAMPGHTRGGRRIWPLLVASLTALGTAVTVGVLGGGPAGAKPAPHASIDCASHANLCAEVADSEQVFGEGTYVGHDEPSNLFYSKQPGSGNQMRYQLWLPKDPPVNSKPGAASFNFQLHPTFWFGMALCATESYPLQVSNCTPDTDRNIVDPAVSAAHPGTAFMEMQFYPPGWVPFQLPGGTSCSATQWCAALTIDSLAENPVTGQQQNATCVGIIGSPEYVNFAFITKNGTPQAPPNPVEATAATFTPDPNKDLFMNSGDHVVVTLHDTSGGLSIDLNDTTSGGSGSMVSSSANGFGQVHFDPTGTSCNNVPYDFHPMYSTSSEQTRVPWAAHTYNVAFSDEVGHFDFCGKATSSLGCSGSEGAPSNREHTDTDDFFCWDASVSTLVPLTGCANSNVPGFDGTSYLADWPDGAANHPTPVMFTSPLTGSGYTDQYQRSAFETDLPRVEQGLHGCDPFTDTGCTLIPITDDNKPADFYPFFSKINAPAGGCAWAIGNDIPGVTVNDFGRNMQYGTYDSGVAYTGLNGVPFLKSDDFRNIFSSNLCPSP